MFQIISFYRFVGIDELTGKRNRLKSLMRKYDIKGTIILAREGFNSTVCGRPEDIEGFVAGARTILESIFEFESSFHDVMPFRRVDVKVKPEIVTLKQPVDISLGEGTHVDAKGWNELISDPATLVLDARNHYEVLNGSFARAIDPATAKFSELPGFVKENLDSSIHKQIAMYCTGGIRCEKFVPYLKARGFENVYQLKGGILKYLETVPVDESLWKGECFVFDDRVTVDRDLKKGSEPDHSLSPVDGAAK